MKTAKTILLALVLCFFASLALAGEREPRPIWLQKSVLEAAAPLCKDFDGVYRIRPSQKWGYLLECQGKAKFQVTITVTTDKAFLVLAGR